MSNGYLLDTNVLSVLGDPGRPQYAAVRRWTDRHEEAGLFTCAVVVGELAAGIEGMEPGARRRRYEDWLQRDVLGYFGARVLPLDTSAALRWGALVAEGRRVGRPRPSDDAKIAAIALENALMVATMNTRDFEPTGVPCVDPCRPVP